MYELTGKNQRDDYAVIAVIIDGYDINDGIVIAVGAASGSTWRRYEPRTSGKHR
jgi:hypothetical protein